MSTKMLVLKTSLVVGVDALKALHVEPVRNDAVHDFMATRGAAMGSLAHLEKHMAPNPNPVIPVSDSGDDWINSADDFELQRVLQESASQAEQRGKQIPNLPDDQFQRMPVQNNNDAVRAVKNLVDQGSSEIDAINFIALELRKNAHELQLAYVLNVSKEPNMAKEESVGGVRLKAADDEQRILEAKRRVLNCVNDYDKNHSSSISVDGDNDFKICVKEVENNLSLPVGILCALQPDLALHLALEQTHGKNMDTDQEYKYVEDVAERFGLKDSDFLKFLQLVTTRSS